MSARPDTLRVPAPVPAIASDLAPRSPGGALRADLRVIADWVPQGARVLDLGCGDGTLLEWLQREKGCSGYGVEIADEAVIACARRGVDVIQGNVERGLEMFGDGRFDAVVMSMAIMATHRTERVVREMARVGGECIVSFPNFGHWRHLWALARGRMPMSRDLPYRWYDTPNLHLATLADFEAFLGDLGLAIVDRETLADGQPVRTLAGKRATQAIYRFRR